MQPVLPFRTQPNAMSQTAKPFTVSRIEDEASPLRPSRRAQGGRERPPVFGRWSAQNRLGSASGRSRPPCAKTNLSVDNVDDMLDDTDVDSGVISERDMRVDHDDFNLVDTSRITRESPTSSRSIEEDNPCP